MIVKFFNRGTGGGSGPVDYLLGKDRDRELAKLEQGDPDEIINLINSCEFTQKYKSGCLSFSEKDLSPGIKNKLMADFEKVLLPGLDKNQYSILWVEHKDKERLELNFVVPCVELTTSKRLQPYYHKIDQKRVDTWKRIINTSLNLHDPDAPENKRAVKPLHVTNLPQAKREQVEQINRALLNQIEIGLVKNRSDAVMALENAGFIITRQAKNTISIKDPNGGKNIKLKGEIYESTFQFSREHASRVRTAQAVYDAKRPENLERNEETFRDLLSKKREFNRKLYQACREKNRPALRALEESNRPVLRTLEESTRPLEESTRPALRALEESNRLNVPLSHIQDAEIQRSHSLNHGDIHRRDGGSSLLDREHSERKCPADNPTKRSSEIGGAGGANNKGENLHNSALQSSEKSIRKSRQHSSSVGAELNDRARETPIGRISRVIKKSRDHVSRFQEYFRGFGQSLVRATDVLRGFTAGKQESDSVSNELNRASHRFSDTVKRFIREEERELKLDNKLDKKLDKKVENHYFGPTLR